MQGQQNVKKLLRSVHDCC